MTLLARSLSAFGTEQFNQIVKLELADIKAAELPLHQATTQGGLVDDKHISISVLNHLEKEQMIEVKLAVFFDEIVGGCSCGDPPMQVNNYCEILMEINKQTATATFRLC